MTAAAPRRNTRARKLVPDEEIARIIDLAHSKGIAIGSIDVRSDGVTIHEASAHQTDEFNAWKAKRSHQNGPPYRQ